MPFPVTRLRRLRGNALLRDMVCETRLSAKELIFPLFVRFGHGERAPISSMPGVFQFSVDQLPNEIREIYQLGIPAVLLFGIPECKDAVGSQAYDDNGVVQQAIKAIKDTCPKIQVITDVCMCEYTDHGHCGVVDEHGLINNDATLELLAMESLSHARAGCDIIAPSDMMDGRIGYIRKHLDEAGFCDIPIISYAAKYASGFYGPFREAADSAPQFGDRRTHQMDPANVREALREVQLDIDEGADMVMVKPALAYLDVIRAVKAKFAMPTVAYNVSGEYAMVKAAAANGWLDEERVMMEMLTSIKRAGADLTISYFAKDAARLLNR